MQTSRERNRPCMSCHNTDRRKPRNLRTTSLFGNGSLDSALSRNSSALLDSPGLYWRDQFVDPCSTWTLGCCSDHTTLDQRNEVIEERGQLVHGCCFVKGEEGLFLARMEPNHAGSGTTAYSGGSPQEACHGNTFSGTEISSYTGSQTPQCQAEGCKENLSTAKHYHRRHKVCELHSKAPTVVVSGLIQRFCQQCSRFHPTSEFDEGKRSCRKRLADHNRRRRKTKPRQCTTSQRRAGTTDLHDHNKKAKALSGHNYGTGIQIIPNMIGSTSTTPTLITSVALSSSGTMTMFPNNYKEQISVLQGTSTDQTSGAEFLYANIPQMVSYLSTRGTVDI